MRIEIAIIVAIALASVTAAAAAPPSAIDGASRPGPAGIQVAQAGRMDVGAPVGMVRDVRGRASVWRLGGARLAGWPGLSIHRGDTIETGALSGLTLIFADDTELSLGEQGRLVVEEMAYDPDALAGRARFSIVRGLFVFVSGRIARLAGEAMTVDMPSATIGIRGSRLIGSVAAGGGRQQVTLLADPDGNVGEIVVTNAAGTQVLNRPQTTTWTIGDGRAPAPPATLPRRLLGRFHPGLQRLFSARRADAEAKIGGARPAVRQAAASDRSRDDDPPPFEILGEATTRIDDGGGSDEVSSGSAGHDPSADAMAAELADFTTASGAPPEVPIPMVGVPYLKPNGSLSQASIQTYVKVRDDHDARTVCQWMPRIRDIILGALQRRPLRHGAVGTRPKGRERLLAKVVNASMKWNLVVDIRLAPYAARSDDPGSERTSFSCEDVEVQAQRKKDARRRGRDVSSLSRRARSGRHRRD